MKKFINKNFVWLIFLGILLRIITVIFSPELGDAKLYHIVAKIFLKTGSVYKFTEGLYPYPPVWIYFEALASLISDKYHIFYPYVIKVPIVLADFGILFLLIKFVKKKKAILLYALNPLIIYVTSANGQFDSIVIFLLLLSYYLFIRRKSLILSGCFLSIGIALKSYPALLIPLYLFQLKKIRPKIIFFISALLPFLLILLPFIISDFDSLRRTYLSYTGMADNGWLAALKAASGLLANKSINFTPLRPYLVFMQSVSSKLFIIFYLLLLLKLNKIKKSLLLSINLVFLLFYMIVGGVATQYLLWITPFIIIHDYNQAKKFVIISSFAMITYVSGQFYDPVLKHMNLFLFSTPFFVNFLYFISMVIYWLYVVRLFFQLYGKYPIRAVSKVG